MNALRQVLNFRYSNEKEKISVPAPIIKEAIIEVASNSEWTLKTDEGDCSLVIDWVFNIDELTINPEGFGEEGTKFAFSVERRIVPGRLLKINFQTISLEKCYSELEIFFFNPAEIYIHRIEDQYSKIAFNFLLSFVRKVREKIGEI